jgi:hypothetical protein
MSKITIVIEVQEATAFTVHPIIGASGKTYGHAMFDRSRGTMVFRMSLEEWRKAKADLCLANRPFYGLVYDVEVEPAGISETVIIEADVSPKAETETDEQPAGLIQKIGKLRRKAAKA